MFGMETFVKSVVAFAIEAPSLPLTSYLCDTVGRSRTMLGTSALGALALATCLGSSNPLETRSFPGLVTARFAASMLFNTCYVYTGEVGDWHGPCCQLPRCA